MKKNSFIEGTIVATLGIILVKIIGIIYVIPLNAIIGEQGGALYGYGYTIYQLFDEWERFCLKMNYDAYVKAKMFGAKDLEEVENWMKDIHA